MVDPGELVQRHLIKWQPRGWPHEVNGLLKAKKLFPKRKGKILTAGGQAEVVRYKTSAGVKLVKKSFKLIITKERYSAVLALLEAYQQFQLEVGQGWTPALYGYYFTDYSDHAETYPTTLQLHVVSEYIEGEDLVEYLYDHRDLVLEQLPLRIWLKLAVDLYDMVAQLRAAGLVHLDLKPENIMVTGQGELYLIDFGLYCLLDTPDSRVNCSTVQVRGTPGFIAPELFAAAPHDLSKADVWAVSALLAYEMVGDEYWSQHLPAPEADNPALLSRAMSQAQIDRFLGHHAQADPLGLFQLLALGLTENPHSRPEAAHLARQFRAIQTSLKKSDYQRYESYYQLYKSD